MPKGDATIAATRITVRSSTSTTAPPPAATMELAADAIPLPIVCTACTIAPPIFFAPLPPFFADVWSIVCCALRCTAALARRMMIALVGTAWSIGRTRMVRVALVMACPLLGAGLPLLADTPELPFCGVVIVPPRSDGGGTMCRSAVLFSARFRPQVAFTSCMAFCRPRSCGAAFALFEPPRLCGEMV